MPRRCAECEELARAIQRARADLAFLQKLQQQHEQKWGKRGDHADATYPEDR